MSALNQLLATLKVEANVFHNGQYCGMWAIDTSGTQEMSFHVVTHGTCYLQVSEEILELNTGDAVFFPSDASHRVSNLTTQEVALNAAESIPLNGSLEKDSTGLVCGHFGHRHPMFEKLLAQLPETIVVRKSNNTASSLVMELMLAESMVSGQSTNLLLNRLSDCLFYLLLRDHLDTSNGVFAALAHPKLSHSMALIHAQTESKVSVDALAAAAGMSKSAFSALFKEILEQSPMEYLSSWRMTQAYRWLADDGISTLEAALRTGYESEASFSKAFKRVMGIGPGEARRT
jgi:AraC-like DNA-binding protein